MEIAEFLQKARDAKASDIHLSAGEPVRLRIHGDLQPITERPVSREDLQHLLGQILNGSQVEHLRTSRDLDTAYAHEMLGRFRVNCFYQERGPAAVLRLIPPSIPTFDELGLPGVLRELSMREKGLVLVTGPTGSGKSTTLAAMIDLINRTEPMHILTIEDPIEFVHTPKKCLVNHREVGRHSESFGTALRAALREDPDVILVGEMRDLETIGLALTAAETGHLVFGTLHTSSAPSAVDRIIDVFPPGQQAQIRVMLADTLAGVVTQTLLKTKDGKGRVAAHEIMIGTAAVRNLVREAKTSQIFNLLQTGSKVGMQTMERALEELLKAGKITRETALARAENKDQFVDAAHAATDRPLEKKKIQVPV
jgi:twitching motility protein PilT